MGWVIDLKSRPIVHTSFRTVMIFGSAVSLLLIMFFFVLQPLRNRAIDMAVRDMEQTLTASSGHTHVLHQEVADKLTDELNQLTNFTLLVVLAVAAGLFYFFLARVIGPLRRAMESQRRFIADASHELRTPLSIMKTNMEVALMEEQLSAEDSLQTIRGCLSEVDRFSNIIQNMLDLSRARDSSHPIPCCAVNLDQIVANAVKTTTGLAASKRIDINVAPLAVVQVWASESALEEVLINLVKNAIQYSPAGSRINIWTDVNPSLQHVRVFVRDWGKGIPPQELPHIFDPFFKGEKSRQHHSGGGYGLGLSIAREIIKRHNGFIQAKSWPGKGTVIYFTLPLLEYQPLSHLPQLAAPASSPPAPKVLDKAKN